MRKQIWIGSPMALALFIAAAPGLAASDEKSGPEGLAAKYPSDVGLKGDPAVLLVEDFESDPKTVSWMKPGGWFAGVKFAPGSGMEITDKVAAVGQRSLQYNLKKGKQSSGGMFHQIKPSETLYYRYYRMFEKDWEWPNGYGPHDVGIYGWLGDFPGPSNADLCFLADFWMSGDTIVRINTPRQKVDPNRWMKENGFVRPPPGGHGLPWNKSKPDKIEPMKWHCVEVMAKVSSPEKINLEKAVNTQPDFTSPAYCTALAKSLAFSAKGSGTHSFFLSPRRRSGERIEERGHPGNERASSPRASPPSDEGEGVDWVAAGPGWTALGEWLHQQKRDSPQRPLRTMKHPALIYALFCALCSHSPAADALAEKPASPPPLTAALPIASADEPFLEKLSRVKAAESLDRISLAWTQQHKCGSCHTTYPFMMSRAVLKDVPSPALMEVRKFFENRIANWDTLVKTTKYFDREVVGTAATLAIHDSQTTGKLQPLTRQALDRIWTLQRADGAWNWPKCSWPPFEVDDYYGVLMVAVGVGLAPEGYVHGESAKAGLAKLRTFFKNTPPPNLHHKTWLLWASAKTEGLMTSAEQQSTIKELLALQRADGGWSMESLGKDWVGHEGEKSNPDAPSDGYGTGLVIYVLRQAGVAARHDAIQRGKSWLVTHQRGSGRWFTRSLNGVPEHYISDTATAFAVLALDACE